MSTVNEVEAKIDAHVDVCAVRYEGIEREMRGAKDRKSTRLNSSH